MTKSWCALAALALLILAGGRVEARPFIDPRSERTPTLDLDPQLAGLPADPACRDRSLAAAGGALPRDKSTLAIRWLGYTSYELVHDGKIILLDAYYDRGSIYPPLGFKAADVRRADLILVGHGHFDHMADAASVAKQTGAPVVAAPVTVEKLLSQGLEARQIRSVTGQGNELLRFDSFTVEPILGRHGEPPRELAEPFDRTLKAVAPLTPEQEAEQAAVRQRGTSDRRVVTEGTIAFVITFADGFRLYYRNSGGRVTEYERAAMARIGRVDVALMAIAANYLSDANVPQALENMRTYKPDVIIPGHHDSPYNLWRATEPIFTALKNENPALITVSRGYREPICFNTEHNIARGR